ncbi:MAG: hypothetical protein VW339_03995, partial [Quisquiliibacterium sp.]
AFVLVRCALLDCDDTLLVAKLWQGAAYLVAVFDFGLDVDCDTLAVSEPRAMLAVRNSGRADTVCR